VVVGLTQDEATTIKTRMSTSLTFRCRPPVAITPGGPAGPQSICTDKDCPLAPNADCSAYDFNNGTSPDPALVNGQVVSSSTATSSPTSSNTAASSGHHSSKTLPIAVGVAVPVGLILIALIAFLIIKQRKKVKTLENRLTKIEAAPPSHGFDHSSYNPPSEPARSTIGGPPQNYQNPTSPLYDQSNHTSSQQFSPDMRHFSGDQSQFKPAPEMQEFPIGGSSPHSSGYTQPNTSYSPPAAPYVQPAAAAAFTRRANTAASRPRHELE